VCGDSGSFLYVMPQIISGLFLVYIRIKYGIIGAIIFTWFTEWTSLFDYLAKKRRDNEKSLNII
jgi:hypothetical protein